MNLKKCIFSTLFGGLLGHVICRDRMLVDLAKVAIMLDLSHPTTVKHLRETLGYIGYYRKFIKGCAKKTATMEKLLERDTKFHWI